MSTMIEVDGVTMAASPEQEAQILADQQAFSSSQQLADATYQNNRTKIRSFYQSCKDGTATIGQMRTAWIQLIEYVYAREIQ